MNLKNDLNDTELLRSMLAGSEEALAELYHRRQGGVYRFALQMSGSKTIAEDVTQEVFLFLMRDGHVFDPNRGSVSAFLFGVARNHVLRRLRVEHLLAPLGDDSDDDVSLLHATSGFMSTRGSDARGNNRVGPESSFEFAFEVSRSGRIVRTTGH